MTKNIKAVLFDFDGVILESIETKTEAMRQCFKEYPQHLDEIIKFHMDQGGISRYVKFEIIFRDILKKELTEEESKRLGELFSKHVFDDVVKSPFVTGALEFLKKYNKQNKLFVVSGTPEEEMQRIVKAKKLEDYFEGVFGSPRKKSELIRMILNDYDFQPEHVIFVGDSINDWHGAADCNVTFIGRVHDCYPNPFTNLKNGYLIHDLNELENLFVNGVFTAV